MDKEELKKLYKETTNKFVERMENMLYGINGCDDKRGRVILKECLKRNQKRRLNMESAQDIIDNCDKGLTDEEVKEIEAKVRAEIAEENKKEVKK